ncbi:hypothetical protein [Phenylobacterium sp.]|uniref:hypothetical protein n=1 Tax=Phenylobacterium sp. TaxID=1871053 RepID=UPI003D27FBEB
MSMRDRRAPPDLLQQARALRAAIRRQTSPGIVDLMRAEIERLEGLAEAYESASETPAHADRGRALRG